MPDINDHMDELMRKAANEYPLRIAGNDWEKVYAQIKPERKRKRPWFWLFIPAVIGMGLLTWFFLYNSDNISDEYAGSKNASNKYVVAETTPPSQVSRGSQNNDRGNEQVTPSLNNLKTTGKIPPSPSSKAGMEFSNSNKDEQPNPAANRNSTKSRTNNKSKVIINPSAPGIFKEEPSQVAKGVTQISLTEPGMEESKEQDKATEKNFIPERRNTTEMPLVIKYIPAVNEGKNDDEKKKTSKPLKFYAGITGGLDVSSVKLQGFDQAGRNFGVIAGIELNEHWAIETGVAINRKYYSTDGKYLKGSYPLPYYATIESATGDCDMLDFPLTARYTINPSKKIRLIVNAGVSSYLMQEESYIYQVNHNGNRYSKDMDYSNSEFTPFAVFTSGVGISYSINKFSIGAEPYFRLPLQKMGTGKLPLQSAGLNLRITRRF